MRPHTKGSPIWNLEKIYTKPTPRFLLLGFPEEAWNKNDLDDTFLRKATSRGKHTMNVLCRGSKCAYPEVFFSCHFSALSLLTGLLAYSTWPSVKGPLRFQPRDVGSCCTLCLQASSQNLIPKVIQLLFLTPRQQGTVTGRYWLVH